MLCSAKTFDAHVHLHGCLRAMDLWTLGKDVYRSQTEELEWYARTYEEAYGKKPLWQSYWNTSDGFERLRADFEIKGPVTFSQFQASFNLIIALCPITPHGVYAQRLALTSLYEGGVIKAHIRIPIPPRFSLEEVRIYISSMATLFHEFNQIYQLDYRFVLHLPRHSPCKYLNVIKDFRNQSTSKHHPHPSLLLGVDLANAEEGFPPKGNNDFARAFRSISAIGDPLAFFYHVGESFESMSQLSAIRWIWEAHKLGVHRLGHALALGLDPHARLGACMWESEAEAYDTATWLLHLELAPDLRYILTPKLSQKNALGVKHEVTKEYAQALRVVQCQIASELKEKSAVIECCPTSNFRIGQIHQREHHPIHFFKNMQMDFVLGSDDPGVFAIQLKEEHEMVQTL